MNLAQIAASRLLFVTGKGGVGKTSFSAALGSLSAAAGKKTLIVEIDNFHPSLTSIFGVAPQFTPTLVSENLSICNLSWEESLRDWLGRTVPVKRIAKLIQKHKIAMLFLDATPGAREIVILSVILELLKDWDQVIVDLPASGHALGFLRVPQTALRLMRTGPIHELAKQVLSTFSHARTGLVLVALPEEMVVNETLEFLDKIRSQVPQIASLAVVLNRASPPSLSKEECQLLRELEKTVGISEEGKELLLAGRWEEDLESATSDALHRLGEALNQNIPFFPRLGSLGGFSGGVDKIIRQMQSSIDRQIRTEVSG